MVQANNKTYSLLKTLVLTNTGVAKVTTATKTIKKSSKRLQSKKLLFK